MAIEIGTIVKFKGDQHNSGRSGRVTGSASSRWATHYCVTWDEVEAIGWDEHGEPEAFEDRESWLTEPVLRQPYRYTLA